MLFLVRQDPSMVSKGEPLRELLKQDVLHTGYPSCHWTKVSQYWRGYV